MQTLVLSTWSLPAAVALAEAAKNAGWQAYALDDQPDLRPRGKIVFYGGTDVALMVAARFQIALLEPTFDLLSQLPQEFRSREVEYVPFRDLSRLKSPTFVKPADALNKRFDAGVYSNIRDIRIQGEVNADCPVLIAEPVDWSAEFRCFIVDRKIVAWSPYVSFGRPNWKPFSRGTISDQPPPSVAAFCNRLFSRPEILIPPAFVMDIGLIDDRGWAVVEFNPAWCSGVLGADPAKVIAVLDRACQDSARLRIADQRWVQHRAERKV